MRTGGPNCEQLGSRQFILFAILSSVLDTVPSMVRHISAIKPLNIDQESILYLYVNKYKKGGTVLCVICA